MPRKSKQSKRKKQSKAQRGRESAYPRREVIDRLSCVFDVRAEEILRLASDGQTPETIAEQLQVPGEKVAKFIDAFTKLPAGLDRQFLRDPSLLGDGQRLQSLVRSATRAAKTQRRKKPW